MLHILYYDIYHSSLYTYSRVHVCSCPFVANLQVESAEQMKFGVCKFSRMAGVEAKDRTRWESKRGLAKSCGITYVQVNTSTPLYAFITLNLLIIFIFLQ